MTCLCTPCTLDRIEAGTQRNITAGGGLPTANATSTTFRFDGAGTLASQAYRPARDGSNQEGDLKHGERR
jgi:hypothetical protein